MLVSIMGLSSHIVLIAVITTCSIAQVLQPSVIYSGDDQVFDCKCPKECVCTDTDIDCSAKNLTLIPKDFNDCYWRNIKLLNLSYNFLTQIESESFVNFPNLDNLLLYNNHITYLDPGAFIGLSQLTILSLDGNYLTTLNINVFKSLTNLKRLLLYDNHISSFTPGIFDNLEKLIILSIHENRLTYLDERLFGGLRNLQRLYIHGNQITDVSNAPFRALHKLELLYLNNNRLRSLTNSSLTGLSSVYAIVFRSNQITEISSGAFVHTPNLLYLYMDYNRLQHLCKDELKHLGQLRIFTVNGNQLQTIEDGAFAQQSYLHTLYLHANQLQNVTSQTFAGLKGLQEIVLYSNKITTLPSRFFADSKQLKRLWLQYNNIRCISETSFMGLDKLELIHLSRNEISYLPNDVFQYTPNLFYIILTSNNISEIKTRPFRNLTKLIQLALFRNSIKFIADGAFDGSNRLFYLQWNSDLDFSQDNRLACDCNSLWLKEYLLRVRPYYETVYCRMHTDDGERGLRLVSAPIEARDCFRGIKLTVTPDVSTIFVKNGSCLELQCRSNIIADITWSRIKGSKQLLTVGGRGCQRKGDLCGNIDTEGLITISQFTYKDEGFYVCSGTHNNDTVYELRHVLIGEPPIIQLPLKDQQHRNPPPYIFFNVRATGNPEPSFVWYKDSNPINMTYDKYVVTESGSLIILSPIQEDSGVYTFVADNGAGSVETSATLTIYFPSSCNQGRGCQNGGLCVPYYQCHCINGYTGDGCGQSTNAPTTAPTTAPTDGPIYSGDYYYYSGDYYYYSGDYYYDDSKRKKRGVPQYDYDFVDMSSRSKEHKRSQRLTRRKMRALKARRHHVNQAVPKQSFKSMDSSTKPLPLPYKTKAESKIDLWTLPKDIVPNPNVQDLKH